MPDGVMFTGIEFCIGVNGKETAKVDIVGICSQAFSAEMVRFL